VIGTAAFTGSLIQHNFAYDAGGVYAGGSAVSFTDTLVIDNGATYNGAVIAVSVSCTGSTSETAGFLENVSFVPSPVVYASASVVSDVCDWGTGATDNTPYELYTSSSHYSYGDDATFTCDAIECL
jgi:hypothetical protein